MPSRNPRRACAARVTVLRWHIPVFRFPFAVHLHLCLFFRVFRFPCAVRPHLCLAFSILRLAFRSVSRSPFALICASLFPFFYFIIILRNALICERSKFVIWLSRNVTDQDLCPQYHPIPSVNNYCRLSRGGTIPIGWDHPRRDVGLHFVELRQIVFMYIASFKGLGNCKRMRKSQNNQRSQEVEMMIK